MLRKTALTAVAVAVASVVMLSPVHAQDVSDDQALHFVLMSASALDSEPEVNKARARSVIATIMDNRSTRDALMLADIANRYRTSYQAATTEAARLQALSQAKSELRMLRSRAIDRYVQDEKANMVLFTPEPPPSNEPGAACLGGSGGLAPYCRDACTGNRPCDKLCRLNDETCTTCGNYGICCCLDGGGNPPPPPPPPPPPGGSAPMSGEPTGAVYWSITSDDDSVLHVTAITDTTVSCSCHQSRASVTITGPSRTSSSSSGLVGAHAQSTAHYQASEAEFNPAGEIIVDTTHESFCPIRGIWFINSVIRKIVQVRRFTARYRYSAIQSSAEPHEPDDIDWYNNDDCMGRCQLGFHTFFHREGGGHEWLEHTGIAFTTLGGATSCGKTIRARSSQPPCVPIF